MTEPDLTAGQDTAPAEAAEREKRAQEGKPKYKDLTPLEISNLAQKEWTEQSALRGPVVVPEWNDAEFWCRRLNGREMVELQEIYRDHGFAGAFCYRSLNSQGGRIFESIATFENEMMSSWSPTIIERVVGEFAILCRTQLTDEELGKS